MLEGKQNIATCSQDTAGKEKKDSGAEHLLCMQSQDPSINKDKIVGPMKDFFLKHSQSDQVIQTVKDSLVHLEAPLCDMWLKNTEGVVRRTQDPWAV